MFTTKERPSFTVVVDEIENHLHPTMQRRILSDLLEAFPHVTFIVSTHSPLIVNSVRNAAVYVLSYNSQNEVESQWLDFQNTAKTASEILDQVLGVSSPMPVWAEDLVKSIVDEFSKPELKKEDFAGIRARLSEIGLAHYLPETLTNIIGHRSQ
jgi:predicted ATP-binding protein involved in virulence